MRESLGILPLLERFENSISDFSHRVSDLAGRPDVTAFVPGTTCAGALCAGGFALRRGLRCTRFRLVVGRRCQSPAAEKRDYCELRTNSTRGDRKRAGIEFAPFMVRVEGTCFHRTARPKHSSDCPKALLVLRERAFNCLHGVAAGLVLYRDPAAERGSCADRPWAQWHPAEPGPGR